MPSYIPYDSIWQDLYVIFDRFESALQTAAIYVQWLTIVLIAVGTGGLSLFLLSKAWKHYDIGINASFPHVAIRTVLIVSIMVLLSGAHQERPGKLPDIVLSGTAFSRLSQPKIWHLRQGANGDGTSAAHPIGSTAALEAVSGPDDIILLHPAESPLDGGLALKPGQALIGVSENGAKPAITNSDSTRNAGNGIVLAEGNRISNVRIEDTYASGIFGIDVSGVTIDEIDIERANRSGSYTTEPGTLGALPHGGLIFVNRAAENAGANYILRSKVIDAKGIGIATDASGAAKSRLFVSDSHVEGGSPVGRIDMGIAVAAHGTSSAVHLDLAETTVRGRMSRGGRNVVLIATADALTTGRIERCHLAETGQDGVLATVIASPATVNVEIVDSIIEDAGQTNIEGTMSNLPPSDSSRAGEASVSIDVKRSIVRNVDSKSPYEDDLIGTGNIWIGSSALAQQMSPGSKAPFLPGLFKLSIHNSRIEGTGEFGIGVGNIHRDISPESAQFEVSVHDNTVAMEGPAEMLIAAPGVIVDARRNCWGASGGLTEERIRRLETGERAQLDASDPISCTEN